MESSGDPFEQLLRAYLVVLVVAGVLFVCGMGVAGLGLLASIVGMVLDASGTL